MIANERSFKSIMQDEKKLKVPFFQRQYVWEKSHWDRFFEDLYESFKNEKEHFLGSIILKRSQGKDNLSNIIDGQQRLTTFSILLKALYDSIDKKDSKHFDRCLFEEYSDDNTPKIEHSKLDKTEYTKIFAEFNNNEYDGKTSGIIGCYNIFKQKIEEYFKSNKRYIFEFMKFINDSKIWVAVCLNANEDEQKIFDSINSTGEPLNATDIVKNALFDKAIKELGEERATELYEEYWEKIFENSEEYRNFWNEKISVGRINRVRSEILLHAFAVMENFFNPDNDKLENLSSIYKNKIKNIKKGDLKNFLLKIYNVAKDYYQLPRFEKETLLNYECKTRFFHIIDNTDTNTVLPLILFLKNKLKDKKDLEECFYILEVLIVINTEKKDYNKFFARIVREIYNNNNLNIKTYLKKEIYKKYKEYLNSESVEEKLCKIENNDAKLILFWIELYLESEAKNFKDKTAGLQYIYQLEHLMPQQWKPHWVDIIDINDENLADKKANELIYQIGNMTLIKGGLNKAIKNSEWQTKLNGKDGKAANCIKQNAELLINKELLDKEKWNEESIKKRTKEIIKNFSCIWNLKIFEEE